MLGGTRQQERIMGKGKARRAAIYLRVSTDTQTTENQRQQLEAIAERRGWPVAKVYTIAPSAAPKAATAGRRWIR